MKRKETWRVAIALHGLDLSSLDASHARNDFEFICEHRIHFGSRYKLGCCGHAGLFAGRIFRCDEFGVRACHARRPFLEPLKSLAKFARDEDSLRSVLEQPARQ